MRVPLIILLIAIWQSGFAQGNDCKYNQVDNNGEKHGQWITYTHTSENSYIHVHGTYDHGEMTGTWHYWSNGFLVKKEKHNNGIVSFTEYYGNNQPKVTGEYLSKSNHVFDTTEIINPKSGKLETVINKQKPTSTKIGTWKYYSIEGKLEKLESY